MRDKSLERANRALSAAFTGVAALGGGLILVLPGAVRFLKILPDRPALALAFGIMAILRVKLPTAGRGNVRLFFFESRIPDRRRSPCSTSFQKLEGTRYQLFVTLDKPALKPLPGQRYEFALWKKARVNIDYHVEVEFNYYSAPYQLVHKEVDVRMTAGTIVHKGQRVAVHRRRSGKGEYSTDPLHRPEKHQKYLEWTPERLAAWAKTAGPYTARMVECILSSRPHPEQGYRSCLGIMRLGEKYSRERLEAACRRALASGAYAYRHVKAILEKGLDRVLLEEAKPAPREHPNLRGAAYYAQQGVR
ncbi:MAG: hypothetical protein AB1556_16335 [Bacillota bacterium]